MGLLKRKLINWALKDLLCAIDEDKIVLIQEGQLYIGGNKATDQQKTILREEAAYLKRTELWKLFQNTLADTARKKMFEKSLSFDDMIWGKSILYALDVLKKIIDKLNA